MKAKPDHVQQYSLEEVSVCDLCGSDRFTHEFTVNEYNMLRCSNCGLVFTSPRYSEDALTQMYKNQYYESAPSYLSCQLEQPPEDLRNLATAVKKMVSPKNRSTTLRSLDVGCGAGHAVAAFESSGWEAVGIDLNQTAVRAGKNLGLNLNAMDISEVEPCSFDVVTAFHVLEHVASPKTFLNQCTSCLVPRGILVIEVPNYESRNARRLREHWPNLLPQLHLYQFAPATLKAYLVRVNLEELRMRKMSGYGPAEDYASAPGAHLRPRSPVKATLQASRHSLYRVPGVKRFLRWLFWQALGYGESIRVLCRKNS